MIRTRVGYAGGTTKNPTYHDIGDYSETVQIDYDPTQISYEELLDVFWKSHDPTIGPFSTQYRSVIFYHNNEQKRAVMESKQREEARLGQKIQTAILPYSEFYLAEDYHQKYSLQGESDLFKELSAIYPDINDLVNSTAAARLNAYAGGYGDKETLEQHLNELGLSDAGKKRLMQIAVRGLEPACPVS